MDFYWKDRPRVSPVVVDRGNVYINKAMTERGVVDMGEGMMSSLGAMRDLNDLVYLGLKSKDNEASVMVKLPTASETGKLEDKTPTAYIQLGVPVKSLQKVYGDKTTRAGLLSKWDNDVSVIPR